jgi:hypothetical protein
MNSRSVPSADVGRMPLKNGITQPVIFKTCSHAPIFEQVAEFNQGTLESEQA